ncbi:hypothetical protein [Cardiobacterium hominis]
MDYDSFGLGMQGLGYLTSALGAYGQAKTDRLNFRHQQIMGNWQTRLNNAYNQYQSDRQYMADQFAAKRDYLLGSYEAEALSMQGRYDRAALEHQEAMSGINAQIQRNNLQHQADIARVNANLANFAKTSARYAGDHAIAQYSLRAGNQKAQARAALAANGVVLDEGSAQELMDSADLMRHIDIDTLKQNALNEAFGHETQMLNQLAQAGMAEANKATIHGEYYGSRGVRTQYNAPMDMSPYVGRQYVTPTPENPVYNSGVSPLGAAFGSLISGAGQFAQSWYNTFGGSKNSGGGNFDYYRAMGLNPQQSRFATNTGKLKWS